VEAVSKLFGVGHFRLQLALQCLKSCGRRGERTRCLRAVKCCEDEWDDTFATNSGAVFRMSRLAIPHMPQGGSLIHTISVNADRPKPKLLAYSATKSAIQNFSGGLAELLGEKGIRSNTVAPGPIWTPLIPATMDKDHVHEFGADSPMKRPGQPAELACAYVLLASDEASYISGANIAVTGGVPVI